MNRKTLYVLSTFLLLSFVFPLSLEFIKVESNSIINLLKSLNYFILNNSSVEHTSTTYLVNTKLLQYSLGVTNIDFNTTLNPLPPLILNVSVSGYNYIQNNIYYTTGSLYITVYAVDPQNLPLHYIVLDNGKLLLDTTNNTFNITLTDPNNTVEISVCNNYYCTVYSFLANKIVSTTPPPPTTPPSAPVTPPPTLPKVTVNYTYNVTNVTPQTPVPPATQTVFPISGKNLWLLLIIVLAIVGYAVYRYYSR